MWALDRMYVSWYLWDVYTVAVVSLLHHIQTVGLQTFPTMHLYRVLIKVSSCQRHSVQSERFRVWGPGQAAPSLCVDVKGVFAVWLQVLQIAAQLWSITSLSQSDWGTSLWTWPEPSSRTSGIFCVSTHTHAHMHRCQWPESSQQHVTVSVSWCKTGRSHLVDVTLPVYKIWPWKTWRNVWF